MGTIFSNNFQLKEEYEIFESIHRLVSGIIGTIMFFSWIFLIIFSIDLFEHRLTTLVGWIKFLISLLMSLYFPYILNRRKSFFKWLGSWEQSLLRRRRIEELQERKSIIDVDGKIYTYCEEYKIIGNKLYFAQKSSKLESEEEIKDNI